MGRPRPLPGQRRAEARYTLNCDEPAIGALVSHVSDPHAVPPDPDKAKLFEGLTPRELEVVRLVVEGLDNAEIGRRVFISPFTAKTHVNRAMAKVGARDRAQLVSLAVQAGIRP
ncbi:response regulator transcription factor [Propionibacterium freudenreichii]|uniref:response regulator transcription factor n=1 Tax=Propionibacterium freudenreichii TaxID=1744 RepID=UPI0039E03F2E